MDNERYIHPFEQIFERHKRTITNSETILPENKAVLLDYAELQLKKVRLSTACRNVECVLRLAKKLEKPFKEATREDIDAHINSLGSFGPRPKGGRPYKKNSGINPKTINKHILGIRLFYRNLFGMKRGTYPECVAQLELFKAGNLNLFGQPTLKPEHIAKMLQSAGNPRDRLIISLLYDTGARSQELGGMNVSDIEDKGDHLLITLVESKTTPRVLAVRNSRPYLLEYLQTIPIKEATAPLFQTEEGKRLRYTGIRNVVARCARTAEIKDVATNPHWFRHSVMSLYAKHFKNDHLTNIWFGWGRQTMAQRYISFSGEDMLEAYNKFWSSKENILRQVVCSCGHVNKGITDYCENCRTQLKLNTVLTKDEEKQMAKETLWTSLMKDEKTKEFIVRRIIELDLQKIVLNATAK